MVEVARSIGSVVSPVLEVGQCLAAPIWRPFKYLFNYTTNFKNLEMEVDKLKNTRDEVQLKIILAERNLEEINQSVKNRQKYVEKTIIEAEQSIQEKANNPRCLMGLCPNFVIHYKQSKKALKLKRDDIDPLLQQEGELSSVSYQTNPPEIWRGSGGVEVAGSVGGVVSPVIEIAKWLAAPTWRQLKYLYNYTTNFKNLEKEVDKLKNTRVEVQHQVTAAERNVEEIKQNVKNWQKDVEKTIIEAEQLIQEKANNPRCFKGLCPSFIIHYKQSKKAFKLNRDDIDRLLRQEKDFDLVSYPTNPPEIWLRSSEDYLAFESRNSTVKNVWDALNDENVFMIGVYGMGGLGKTTLVEELGRKAEKDKLFEDIVFVEVSESPDVKKIQTTIANKLGLKFATENESEMANKMYSRMKDKNILLILDNIWEPLEFEKTIGIPCGADRGRNKFLFTTRNLAVLQKMGSTNNFRIEILNEDEAWKLFAKMADLRGNIIQTDGSHSLQNDVCKKCRGLPIVICTIGKALKNKTDPLDWEVALQELRAPSPTNFTGLLEKECMKIALSYTYLRNDELKKTFLIASLLENNTSISDLFKHVVCLDILKGANLTMQNARGRLYTLVRQLKEACLLLDGVESEQFAMCDIVRSIAITIAYGEHHVFTVRNDVERDWKDKGKLKKCTKISLPGNSTIISQLLPSDLDCPDLEYFSMSNMSNSSIEILKDSFTMLSNLKVLNLVKLQQSSLPSSIVALTNLQTLCLDDSEVKDFAIIGKLETLKVLSLRELDIEEFPSELGQLTQLRLLDLSGCWQLKVITPNVISQLSKLEEFYIKGCPIKWKHEVLKELKLLSNLTNLELDIKDNNALPEGFFSKELIRYKISVGNWFKYPIIGEYECLRILKLIFNPMICLEELCGLKKLELLGLAECLDYGKNLERSKFNLQSNEITPLFNKKVIFYDLKVLVLKNIISRKIWDSQLSSSSFENLEKLILWRCTKIKFVFPYAITKNLERLQYLEIMDCIDLEEIVATEEIIEAAASFVFPQVTFLKLGNLPEFANFYPGINSWEWPKLEGLVVKDCDKFKMFNSEPNSLCLDHEVIFPNLKVLELKNISLGEIWNNKFSTYSYQNLTHLSLYYCDKIKYVFPLSLAKSFQQLQYLELMSCEVLEIIVAPEEGTEAAVNFFFPLVRTVKLQYLPEFIDFYPGIHTLEWPKLKELMVKDCPKFKMFTSESNSLCLHQKINFNLEVFEFYDGETNICWQSQSKIVTIEKDISANIPLRLLQRFENVRELQLSWSQYKDIKSLCDLPNLEILEVDYCYRLISLVPFSGSFQNLKVLKVSSCNRLIMKLITLSVAKSLAQLRELSISYCDMLTEIVDNEGDATSTEIVFNSLNKLSLESLESLICFCSGNYSFSFPSLEELIIKACPNLKIFCQGSLCTPKLHRVIYNKWIYRQPVDGIVEENHLNTTIQQKHKKEVGSSRKELTLSGRNIMTTLQGEFQENFGEVKALQLIKDDHAYIPIHTLMKFINLEELILKVSSYEEIFSCEKGEEHVGVLSKLKVLHLQGLFNLKCIWKQDIRFKSSLQNLHSLNVEYCHSLKTLLPPLSSYKNLTIVEVKYCNEMQNLMTSSTAKSLNCLKCLSIKECEMMIHVLANEGDTEKDEIVFERLEELHLFNLESLTCFYYGNYTLQFPFLKSLNVDKCFKMKTFSREGVNMPKLQQVNWEDCSNDRNYVTTQLQNECSKLWERYPW